MHRAVTIVLTFLLLAIESPLLHKLGVSFYAPDFGLIAVLYVAGATSLTAGIFVTFIIGLLKDAFALGSPIGLYTQIAVIVFLIARGVSSHVNLRPVGRSIIAAFVASLVSSLLFLGLTAVFDRTFDAYDLVLRMMGPQAAVTAPFAPILFVLFEKSDSLFARRRSRL